MSGGISQNPAQFTYNRSSNGQVQGMGPNQIGPNIHVPNQVPVAFNQHMNPQPSNINPSLVQPYPSDSASVSLFAYTEKLQTELCKSRWWIMKLAEERSNLLREHNMINVAADAVGKYEKDGNNSNELTEIEFWKALTFASLRELHHRNELTPQSIARIRNTSMANGSTNPPLDTANHEPQVPATESMPAEPDLFQAQHSALPLVHSEEIDFAAFLDAQNADLFSVPRP